MFFVVTKRVVKVNTGSTERFTPRSNNVETWTVNGPFSKRPLAERAAVSALSTHTCTAAMVLDFEGLEAAHKQSYGANYAADMSMERALKKAIDLYRPKISA